MSNAMSRALMSAALALGALAVVGGFSPGAGTAEAAPNVSPFAGSWSGTWTGIDNGQDGTLDWTVSDAGRLSGRVHHNQDGDSGGGAIRGHIDADGKLMLIAFAPADDHLHGNGIPHMGTVAIDGGGNLVAAFTGTYSGGVSVVAILKRN